MAAASAACIPDCVQQLLYRRRAAFSDPRKGKAAKRHEEAVVSPGSTNFFSLFRAFVLLFGILATLHRLRHQRLQRGTCVIGQPPISVAAFLLSAKFSSSTLQTWQASI